LAPSALESAGKAASGYFYPDIAAALPRQTLLIEKIVELREEPKETKAEKKPAKEPERK